MHTFICHEKTRGYSRFFSGYSRFFSGYGPNFWLWPIFFWLQPVVAIFYGKKSRLKTTLFCLAPACAASFADRRSLLKHCLEIHEKSIEFFKPPAKTPSERQRKKRLAVVASIPAVPGIYN
jgi:hypothetical protein